MRPPSKRLVSDPYRYGFPCWSAGRQLRSSDGSVTVRAFIGFNVICIGSGDVPVSLEVIAASSPWFESRCEEDVFLGTRWLSSLTADFVENIPHGKGLACVTQTIPRKSTSGRRGEPYARNENQTSTRMGGWEASDSVTPGVR